MEGQEKQPMPESEVPKDPNLDRDTIGKEMQEAGIELEPSEEPQENGK